MRNATSQVKPVSAKQTTTVFTSGNSQAVRLPKAFRFDSQTVEIERQGDEIILREKKQTVGEILRHLPAFNTKAHEAWAQALAAIEDQPPQERDWNVLLGADQPDPAAATTPPRAARSKAGRA